MSIILLSVSPGLMAGDLERSNVVVIVNPSVKEQDISMASLRAIFGMRLTHWENGAPIRVYVLPDDHPTHSSFSKQVLGMFPYQLRWAWDRLVYSGTGEGPIQVSSEEEMKLKVSNTPGAIGYLTASRIDEKVKVPTIK